MSASQQSTDDSPTAPFTKADLKRVGREELVTTGTILLAWVGLPVRGMAGVRARRAAGRLRQEAERRGRRVAA